MPFITSANIACGAHAGDERTMRETIQLAIANGVAPGAHPGYRDPANFGRKALDIPPDALTADSERAAAQAVSFMRDGGVRARDGSFLEQGVDTLCVHGDTPGAAAILRAARAALVAAGVAVHRVG